jgi:glycosyltransferase involved in cell wall biosynthesis
MERCTWLRVFRPSCPVVWEINGTSDDLLAGDAPDRHALQQYRRDVRRKRRMARLVDAAFSVGPLRAEYARRIYGVRRCLSIPNGGDLAAFLPQGGGTALAAMRDRFKVFWAGDAGQPWQGLGMLLAAARICETSAPDVLFVLMLGGKHVPASLPHAKNVLYLAGGDRPTACRYLADADCAVAVYKPCAWRSSSTLYPLKALEAMAARKPLIFDDLSRDVARDGVEGLHVRPDAESLADAVRRLRADTALRETLAANARARIESAYTWRHVVDRIEPVLLELVRRPSQRIAPSSQRRPGPPLAASQPTT